MGKRFTILAISAVALLLAGIAFAVSRLYAPEGAGSRDNVPQVWDVLRAVPSDAVAVFVFDGSQKAAKVVADSTGLLSAAISQESPAMMAFLSECSRNSMVVSLHNSGTLVPLVAVQLSSPDSLLEVSASKAGLKTRQQDGFLLASKSETFVNASARNLEEGTSVMAAKGLSGLLSQVSGHSLLLVNHAYSPKIADTYASSKMRSYGGFMKKLTSWSAWEILPSSQKGISINGTAAKSDASGSFFAAFKGYQGGEPEFAQVLPYYTSTAISFPVQDVDALVAARRSFEDGNGRLVAFNKALKARPAKDITALEWLRRLQPRELVKASFKTENGINHQVLLLRSETDLKMGKESPNAYRGCLGSIFGPDFNVVDTVCSAVDSRWTVFGDLPSVQLFADRQFLDYSLKDRMDDASVSVPSGFVVYSSLTDAPESVTDVLGSRLAKPVSAFVGGSGYAPLLVSLDLSGESPLACIGLEKHALKGTKVQVLERDTTVVVPKGYFPVKNCGTGKTNHLYQNSHLSICLNDENGKGLWGIPFKEPLCGRVQNVDYYANGKIQFLFAAGSKLYLLDRLGHWVNGFPVELGKQVLLGPDVYDFSGAGGYSVMVLHKDNTLQRYNLHGRKPEGWKGISPSETVKNLPELIRVNQKNYWAVRTSVRTFIYPFDGGEPLVSGEGSKMIKPDARITVTSKGISAECHDGRERDFKLN